MEEQNKKVTIGILTMPPYSPKNSQKSLINSFYLEWIESFGVKVVPIPYNFSLEVISEMLQQVNGLILQGGNSKMEWPYTDEIKIKKLNKYGFLPYECVVDFILQKVLSEELKNFPIFSICWNFELIPCIINGGKEGILNSSNSVKENFSLINVDKNSKLFSQFNEYEINLLSTEQLTFHYHRYHINPKTFLENEKLQNFFKITSLSKDKDGVEFISSYEHILYPIFGLQFHPEKVGLNRLLEISSSISAIEYNRKFGLIFIEESKKNNHKLNDPDIIINKMNVNKEINGRTRIFYVFSKDDNTYVNKSNEVTL